MLYARSVIIAAVMIEFFPYGIYLSSSRRHHHNHHYLHYSVKEYEEEDGEYQRDKLEEGIEEEEVEE